MTKYRYKRSSLQFPCEFIKYLDEIVPKGFPKNHFLMGLVGFRKDSKLEINKEDLKKNIEIEIERLRILKEEIE